MGRSRFWDTEATAREREGLCQQLNEIDFVELGDLLAGQDETTDLKPWQWGGFTTCSACRRKWC